MEDGKNVSAEDGQNVNVGDGNNVSVEDGKTEPQKIEPPQQVLVVAQPNVKTVVEEDEEEDEEEKKDPGGYKWRMKRVGVAMIIFGIFSISGEGTAIAFTFLKDYPKYVHPGIIAGVMYIFGGMLTIRAATSSTRSKMTTSGIFNVFVCCFSLFAGYWDASHVMVYIGYGTVVLEFMIIHAALTIVSYGSLICVILSWYYHCRVKRE